MVRVCGHGKVVMVMVNVPQMVLVFSFMFYQTFVKS